MLRIRRLLDAKRDLILSQFRRLHCRLRRLVLSLYPFFCSTNLVVPSSKRHKLTHYLGMTWCRLVLSLHSGTGVHQQLHQSAHLRCQVPRVPACRQTIKYDVIENCMAVPWQVVTLTAGVFLDGGRRRRNAYDKITPKTTEQHFCTQ